MKSPIPTKKRTRRQRPLFRELSAAVGGTATVMARSFPPAGESADAVRSGQQTRVHRSPVVRFEVPRKPCQQRRIGGSDRPVHLARMVSAIPYNLFERAN